MFSFVSLNASSHPVLDCINVSKGNFSKSRAKACLLNTPCLKLLAELYCRSRSFRRRSSTEIRFFPQFCSTTNKWARFTIRKVLDEVFVDEDRDYNPDVENRTSNSSKQVSEAGQDVNIDTTDETVVSGLPKTHPKNTFLSLFVFEYVLKDK